MRLLELFSGTGSVGHAFERTGWEVVSLDLDPRSSSSICCDVLTWDYSAFPPCHFDAIWSSPPCTEYSIARTTAKTPRNLELADSLVQRTLNIIQYFSPKVWWLENPDSGLLKTRPLMDGIPRLVTDYCPYGSKYRKRTSLWTNVDWSFKRCPGPGSCPSMIGRCHLQTAQRGPGKAGGTLRVGDRCSLDLLHALPEALTDEIVRATVHRISQTL